jgi:hypothetical protein
MGVNVLNLVDTLSANWNQLEEQIYSAYELIKALDFQEGSKVLAAA